MKPKTYTLKSVKSGLFFVRGSGFTAKCDKEATQLSDADVNCARSLLEPFTMVEVSVTVSFAVNYIRKGDVGANGVVTPNKKNPSKRRFATRAEANQHGSRFYSRVAKKGDKPGSAGHIGFYVTETTDKVNASINWETGLTNAL